MLFIYEKEEIFTKIYKPQNNFLLNEIMQNPLQFFQEIPPVTKAYVITVFAMSFALTWEFVQLEQIAYYPVLVWNHFEVWRLILPAFVYGKLKFDIILTLFAMFVIFRVYFPVIFFTFYKSLFYFILCLQLFNI